MRGEITADDQVRYVEFVSDGMRVPLGHTVPPATVNPGEAITVAFQLDGNYQQDAYRVTFDEVDVRWHTTSPW